MAKLPGLRIQQFISAPLAASAELKMKPKPGAKLSRFPLGSCSQDPGFWVPDPEYRVLGRGVLLRPVVKYARSHKAHSTSPPLILEYFFYFLFHYCLRF